MGAVGGPVVTRPRSFIARCGALVLLLFAGCVEGGSDVDVWEFLGGDLSRLAETPAAKSVMFSSYDRTGGNDDGFSGLFSRLRIDENGEHVLAEMDGPGCVKRIWMTWPGRSTRIRIYVDGKEAPALDLPIDEFFSGDREPFVAPFVGGDRQFGGINFSYVPIPFAKSIRITTVDGIRFYQINAHAYPKGSKVKSFAFPPRRSDRERLARAREEIAALPDTVTMEMPWTVETRKGDEVVEDTLGSRGRWSFPRSDGKPGCAIDRPGEILELRVALEGAHHAWRGTRLLAWWDDEVEPLRPEAASVDVPLAELFGSAFAAARVRSVAVLSGGHVGILRLPMPFRRAHLLLHNGSGERVRARLRVLFRPADVSPDGMRLHASRSEWNARQPDPFDAGVPYLDTPSFTVLRACGRGAYIGTVVSAHGGWTASFLEGDETVVVDGDTASALRGTGTEDYFNSGWYFAGPGVPLPFSGVSFKREDPAPRVSGYRWHFSDRIAFADSLLFRLGIGDGAIEPEAGYSAVALWYQAEPHEPRKRSSPHEGGRLLRRVAVFPRHMTGIVNRDSEYSENGKDNQTGWTTWTELAPEWAGRPSPILLYSGYAPGSDVHVPPRVFPPSTNRDTLNFYYKSPRYVEGLPEGRYDVSLVYAKAPLLGRIEAWLEGKRLLDPVDCGADSLIPAVVSPPVRMVLEGNGLDIEFRTVPTPLEPLEGAHAVWPSTWVEPDMTENREWVHRKLSGIVSGVLLRLTEPTIDRWLVAGPFEDPACTRFDSVYAPEREHEAGGIRPDAVYRGIDGADVRWKEARADSLGFVDLRDAIGKGTHRIAYGAVWVFSPRARSALFSFGSDDGAQVWLNGERVHRWPVHRGWDDDQDRFIGELKAGWNEILVKVEQRIAGWGFSLRLSDARLELVFSTRPE